jgi:hypothetical protein
LLLICFIYLSFLFLEFNNTEFLSSGWVPGSKDLWRDSECTAVWKPREGARRWTHAGYHAKQSRRGARL